MRTFIQFALRSSLLVTFLALSGCLSDGGSADENAVDGPPPAGNNPPSISGSPPGNIRVGEAYSFTPQASDPDGDTLTFSIDNRPPWASFNTGSGRLTGIPTLGDVGQYSNVRISVSDDQASASLPGFAIDVTQVGASSITLSWTAPTQNEDGSTLTDLAGFKIYYGRSPGSYTDEIRIDNPSVTTYVVENLSAGTYYFAATAFNAAGIESRYSDEGNKTLN